VIRNLAAGFSTRRSFGPLFDNGAGMSFPHRWIFGRVPILQPKDTPA
jgi:hypothetical protein